MAVPDYQTIMLPLLRYAADTQEASLRNAIDHLANEFGLAEENRKHLLPSGRQPTFDNRVGWARTYMKKAGLLESTRRGFFRITERGLQVLAQNPARIDDKFLSQFPEFLEFQSRKEEKEGQLASIGGQVAETPEEQLEFAYQRTREELSRELLKQIMTWPATFFEKLVVELLVKIGYGGSRLDAGQAIGRTGDEGIDGIIKEDKLGLDIIYIQAKRWTNTVGRPEIQKFVGALQGQRARKGIFITTSSFSKDAVDYAASIESKVVLIDGQKLAELMIDHNLGVSTIATYELKKIDTDYFTEE
ncbi:MAG: restriction endonuclease [Candidatus Methylomirabilia bacterium]